MADPQILAKVIRISGRVVAKNEDGETRELKLGDSLREGETVITDAGARVELAFVDGSVTEVAERTSALISAEMSEETRPDAAAASIGEATIAQVVEALERGDDLGAVLEEPAAGLTGGGGGDGSGFVRLLRISEGVGETEFAFADVQPTTVFPFESASATAADQGQTAPPAPAPVDLAIELVAPPLTNDGTPTISGTTDAPAGSSVTLVVTDALGVTQTIVVTVDAQGGFSGTPSLPLADGPYQVTGAVDDGLGNVGNANAEGVVDTLAPGVVVTINADGTVSFVFSEAPVGFDATDVGVANGTLTNLVQDSTDPTRWTADLTPAAGFEGAVVVEVPAGSYTDTAGNAGSGDSDTTTVDTLAPSVQVTINADGTVSFVFSEAPVGFDAADVGVANGTITNLVQDSTDPTRWTADLTPAAGFEGAVTVSVPSGSYTDTAGNAGSGDSDTITVDTLAPSVQVTINADGTVSFVFSEAPVGFDAADVGVTNGTITNLVQDSTDPTRWTANLTPAAGFEGAVVVEVPAGSYTDTAGNAGSGDSDSTTVDTLAPSVTVTINTDGTVSFVFSEAPVGFDVADVGVTNGTITNLVQDSTDPTRWTADLTPAAGFEEAVVVEVPAGSYTDAAGNAGLGDSDTTAVDTLAPSVQVTINADGTVSFVFSEAPVGFDAADVGVANGTITNLVQDSTDPTRWTADLTPAAGFEGAVVVEVPAGSYTDTAGNAGSGDSDTTAVDTLAPSVQVTINADGTVSFVFSEAPVGFDAADVGVANGTITNLVQDSTDPTRWTANLTPAAGFEGAVVVEVPAGSYTDTAGNAGSGDSDSTNVDTLAPSVQVTINADGTVSFVFSEAPVGFDAADVGVANGTLTNLVQDSTDPTRWTANLTPTAGFEGAVTVSVPSGSYTDTAGNAGSGDSDTITVDTLAPSVQVTINADGTVSFVFSEAPVGFDAADVGVTNGTITNLVQDSTDPTRWTANLTPAAGFEGAVTVSVPSGSYTDTAGNAGSGDSDTTTVDTLSPSVQVTINADGTVSFVFSEAPVGFDPSDVAVSNGTLTNLVQDSTDPTQWTADLTPAAGFEGAVVVEVPAGSYTDIAGNVGSGDSDSTTVDTLAPSVTVTINTDGTVSFVFSEAPVGFDATDVGVANGTLTNLVQDSTDPTRWTADLTPAAGFEGAVVVEVPAGSYTDTAGNAGSGDSDSTNVDTLAPSVQVTINVDGTVSFVFSEAPVGFDAADVGVANGTITNLVQDSTDPTRWTADLTPAAGFEGAVVVEVPAGSYTDTAGNAGSGDSDSTNVDTLAPSVQVTINVDGTVSFVFSEAPVGFDAADVGVANGTITNLVQDSTDPTRWTADLTPAAGFEGAVVVEVPAGSYTDTAGNAGSGDSDSTNVDTLAPSVQVTINVDGTVSFVFSEAPVGFDAADVGVANGTITNLVQDSTDPTRWTADLTPAAGFEGAVVVEVPAGSYTDTAGNAGSGDSDSTNVDTLAPSVQVTINVDGTVSFVFSEAPVGFDAADVGVANGTLTNLVQDSTDPTRWTANLTPTAGFEGAVTVSVPSGSYTDTAGNAGSGDSDTITVDTLAPSVQVTINADGTVSFVFSEAPVGFDAADVGVTNGTITNLVQDSTDPTRWTANLTPAAGFEGAVVVEVPAGSYTDTAGNAGSGDSDSTTVDTLAPSVTVTINTDGTVSFVFSEAPVGFDVADVGVTNGTITNLVQDSTDPTRWTADLTPAAGFEEAVVVEVPAGSYTDAAGNAGLGDSDTTTVDTLAPSVQVTINADGTVSFVFSEAPVGFDAADVGVANGTITNLVQDSTDPTRWTADLTPAAGFEGAVVVEVPAGSYTDTAGNAGSGDSDTTAVDTLAPSVQVTINADGTVSFVFSEAPVGFDAADVGVANGTITNLVQDSTDPTRWTANLTPAAGFEGAVVVEVPAGSYTDTAGNAGSGDSDSTNVDTLAPSVQVTINADGTVSFVFSEAPVGFDAADVGVANGTLTNLVQDSTDPTRWTANLTPTAGFEGAVTVSVPSGSYTDTAGNAGSGDSDTITVDTLAPSVQVTINADGTVSFVFSEAPVGFDAADVGVTNGTITNLVQDSTDPTRWTANLTPAAGFEGAVTVSVPSGSYTDTAGNAGSGDSDTTTVDTLSPSVQVTINADGTVSFVFSEAPVGFDPSDVAVSNGTLTNLVQDSTDPTQWTADLTPAAGFEGAVVVEVPAGSYTDIAGNVGSGDSDSTTVDTLAPSVTVTINTDGTVSFVFSEAPVGFDATDVGVANGTLTNLVQDSTDPTRWTADLTPAAGFEGAVVVEVPAGSYTDTAGNAGSGDSDTTAVDTLAPSVQVTINADGTVSFVFSEAPVGFDAADVGVANGTITNLVQDSTDPTRWTANLTPAAGFEGAVVVEVPAGSYTDTAGNAGSGDSDSTTVDTLAPSVTVTINTDGTVSFVFSEAPVGFDATDVGVANGTITNLVQDSTDPTRWTADLTPAAGFEGAVVVEVPAGSYTDTAGNAGSGDSDTTAVDTLAPSVQVTINADGTVSFVFSEAPVGFDAADVGVANGTITNLVQDSTDPTRWTADLTPAAGFEGAVVVEVPAGSYTDTAGNAGSGDSDTITVDTLAPSVTVALNDVNSTNVTATLITGTTAGVEPDQIVTLTITDGVNTVTTVATVEADGSYSITADLSALIDGTLTVTAVVSDLAGNSVTADALGVKAIADVPILGPIDDVFMLTPGATVISTGSVDKLVSPGAFDSGGGVRLSELEKELGLPDGFLDKRFDPSGPNVNDPGTVSVTDGKLTESHYAMTSGTTVHWDYVFTNGENLTYEVSGGFNDLIVLLVTDPLGNKQAILANASEAKFPASSISDSLDFTATMDGEYTFQWVLLNGGDRLKDSSLELGAAKFAVAGDSAAYGAPVRLPVFAGLADTDGSETLSVVVSGVPAGGRFTSGTDNGDGTWTFAASELGNLVFLPPAAFAGTISLGVSAIATESANGDAAVTQQTVTLTIDQSDSTFTQSGEAGQTINGTAGDDLIRGYAGNDTINAGAGDDLVYGGADNDTVRGGTGNDWLYGGQGADTLYGEAGNDVVIGGAGNDVLYGGAGADVFKWSLGDQGSTAAPAVDVVKDFTPSQGDVLDLRDLLIGEAHQGLEAGNLADYLSFDYVPGAGGATGTTVIAVKTLGADMSGPDQIIRLESVDLLGGVSDDQQIIQNLLASGKLITD